MKDLPWRRPCITESIPGSKFAITVSYDPRPLFAEDKLIPCEVFVTKRAKIGSDLDTQLAELGIVASKLMQGEIE